MKRIIILTICVILIIVIAIAIWNIKDEPIEPSIVPPAPSDLASQYFVNDVPKSLTVGKANVNVTLPLFDEVESTDENAKSLSDLSFAEEINNQVLELFDNYYQEIVLFKDGVSFDDDKNDIIKNKQYKFVADYDRYDNGSIISLVINLDYNTSGLRSNAWKEVFNIDVEKNKKISLSDLFSSSAYRSQIVDEVNKQAKEKSIKLIEPEGIKTIPEDQKFYIKDHKLIIYFENSAISKSELEFVMPFEFNATLNKFSI